MTGAISEAGLQDIRAYESLRLNAYRDGNGVPTIGYGATRYENGQRVQMGDTITYERAEQLLLWYVRRECEVPINALVVVPLNQDQFDSLCALVYNIGAAQFATSTLLKVINAGNDPGAVAEQIVRWRKDNGEDVRGLWRRRCREAELYLFGRPAR